MWCFLGEREEQRMGWRFRKSFKIAPGIKLNLNKKSTSVTFGGKGFHYTVNSNGKKLRLPEFLEVVCIIRKLPEAENKIVLHHLILRNRQSKIVIQIQGIMMGVKREVVYSICWHFGLYVLQSLYTHLLGSQP